MNFNRLKIIRLLSHQINIK